MTFEEKAEVVISQLRTDRDRLQNIIEQIRAEIEQEYKVESEHPYGQGLRRALDIINKYKVESEDRNG